MSRERHRGMIMEGLIIPTKIRKRGCSSSSSSSSRIHNHRLNKRAGKTRAGLLIGLGGSRSSTPVPTWRTTPLRSAVDSPKYSQSGRSTQPVSARRLAATLWEMNGMPPPKMSGSNLEATKLHQKKGESKMVFKREKMQSGWSGLPPHLSDPSHSPTVSEPRDRSAAGSCQRTPSISQKLRSAEQSAAAFDSITNASLMEVETRSQVPASSASVTGRTNRLKDVNNALTTSKELLKIINRLWARVDQPSSSLSIISALHAELERARLQVNHLIKEQHSGKSEINHLVKSFAEEKASWKVKEQRAVEEAIESIGSELEAERKLRRRVERLNKKLGKELADLKSSFLKAVEDLESEKRAREITEQMCSELARNIDEDRNEVEMVKTKAVEAHEEKNSAISKLRKQLEAFLGTKRDKDEKRAVYSCERNEHENEGEDVVAVDNKEDSGESDIQSIKCHRWACASGTESMKLRVGEIKSRNSISGQVSRRSTSVLDGVEGAHHRNSGDGIEKGRLHEIEALKRMGLKEDRVLSSSRLSSSARDYGDSPSRSRQQDHHPSNGLQVKETSCKSRLGDVRREGQTSRRWKQ